jgi:hypothetical protein
MDGLGMWRTAVELLVLGYVPGALLWRLPTRGRPARAQLPAEERVFWAVAASLAVSSAFGLLLAAFGAYSLTRVLVLDALVAGAAVVWSRGDLRWPATAPRPTRTAWLPVVVLALGFFLYTPPGELILGGKDPGVYVNEGIQIARRGSLLIHDPVVANVPVEARDLFFPWRGDPTYHGLRFMGFFVLDPAEGTVLAQFPHLYPLWVAFGYDLAGVAGARAVVTATALAGLVAVYFAAAWLLGRPVALAGAILLSLNVAEVWFGRYSNSELGLQALVFASMLAWARADEARGRLFGLLAGTLIGLSLFLRLEAILVFAAVGAVALLSAAGARALPRGFGSALALWAGAAALYFGVLMRPYGAQLAGFVGNLPVWATGIGTLAAILGAVWIWRRRAPAWVREAAPRLLVAVVLVAAGYAYFLRRAGGRLAIHDAAALRTFAAYYLGPFGLAAAVAGFAWSAWRRFWRQPAFFLTLATFALFFFYKVRIVPEHFWMARRFLPVVLPGALVMVAAAAWWPLADPRTPTRRSGRLAWIALGSLLLVGLGWRYWQQSAPIRAHVEYEGATRQLARLDRRFGPNDLVIVESRQASDLHVLALPLAYIYGRDVLVLESRRPDTERLRRFVAWAWTRYANVFFLGGGGTDLVSPELAVEAIAGERFQLPEYDSPLNAYPSGRRFKEFDFGIYRFVAPGERPAAVTLDVGTMDDVYVVRFHAKERHAHGETFRWSRDESYVSLLPPARAASVTLWLSNGGRPATAPPARVSLFVEGRSLGSATVGDGFRPYRFEVPPDLAAAWTSTFRTVRFTLRSTTWNPRRLLGVPDDRDLGVMVDRIEVR